MADREGGNRSMEEKNPKHKVASEEDTKQPREQKKEQAARAGATVEEPESGEAVSAVEPPATKERRFRQTDLPAHFIERRRHPRISTEQPPPPAPPRIDDYAPIIGQPELDEIRF